MLSPLPRRGGWYFHLPAAFLLVGSTLKGGTNRRPTPREKKGKLSTSKVPAGTWRIIPGLVSG